MSAIDNQMKIHEGILKDHLAAVVVVNRLKHELDDLECNLSQRLESWATTKEREELVEKISDCRKHLQDAQEEVFMLEKHREMSRMWFQVHLSLMKQEMAHD